MKAASTMLVVVAMVFLTAASVAAAGPNGEELGALPEGRSFATAVVKDQPMLLAQNANYVACYKEVDMKNVLFRWCPTGSPWTATNEKRAFCYATSAACAEAEMPQSWCIKCEGKE